VVLVVDATWRVSRELRAPLTCFVT
jgi:hypothetical protein